MKIRKILFLSIILIGLSSIIPIIVNATVGEEFLDDKGFKYKIITEKDDGENEVELCEYTGAGTDIVIPGIVKNNDITYIIKSIGSEAFRFNSTITSVKFAEDSKLEKIIGGAFYGATSLESVYLPETLTTFEGLNAFTNCEKLSTIELPNSLTDLGRSTFYGCTSLKSIIIPEKVTTLNQNFQNCTNLEKVTIKGALTSLGHFTFFECKNLTDIVFEKPFTLDYVGNCLFYNCEKLNMKEFHIDEGITSIGNDAFYNFKLLEVVSIPSTVQKIDARAFTGCENLEKLIVLSENCSIGIDNLKNCSNNLIIYGFKNSTIEEYCNTNGINTFIEIYKVINNVTNIKSNGLNYTHKDFGNYTTILSADEGYILPDMIYILVNGSELNTSSYSYNNETGELIIPAERITGNIFIEGNATEIKYKVIFDANEGTFENGKILTIEKWENGIEETLEKPTRDGFEFLGFFTEKNGGTKLELILAESGIDSDITFYAHWKDISQAVESTSQIENDANNNIGNIENSNTNLDLLKNPQTGDNIILFSIIFIVSILGIIVIRKIKKSM